MQLLTKDLNELYRSTPALYERDNEPGGFQWINGGRRGPQRADLHPPGRDGNPLVCAFELLRRSARGFRAGVALAAGRLGGSR